MSRKQTVCTHEPHHAKGLCRPCFDFFRKQPKTNVAPPEIPDELRAKVEAAGSLVPREDKRFRPLPSSASGAARQLFEEVHPAVKVAQPVQKKLLHDINTADPKVAAHVAGAVARSLHDFQAAARLLRPDLAPAEQAALAHQLERDPNVRAAIQAELEKLGLSDGAKQKYFALLWSAATDMRAQAERDRLNAMRLLARAFLPSEDAGRKNDAPAVLPIAGLEQGLRDMGLADAPAQTTDSVEIDAETQAEMERED